MWPDVTEAQANNERLINEGTENSETDEHASFYAPSNSLIKDQAK
jgi:hypothetical protein